MSDERAALIAKLPGALAAGKIGFFWVVADINGKDVVLAEAIGLAEAELSYSFRRAL